MRTLFAIAASAAFLWSLPAQAQRSEISVAISGSHSEVNGVLSYGTGGVLLEATRFAADRVGITGELGYSAGTGTLHAADVPMYIATAMGGIRVRFPNRSRFTTSARFIAGAANLDADTTAQGFYRFSRNMLAMSTGGAVDIGISRDLSFRAQAEILFLRDFGSQFRAAFGIVVIR